MKRVAFTVSISLAAFIAAAALTRSGVLRQRETVPYFGSNGWTLKRNIILTPTSSEPRIVGRDVLYFAADGRCRQVTYRLGDDGTEICETVSVWIPGRGAFHEMSRDQQLVYVSDYEGFGGDIDVRLARKDPNYVSDQQILGYNCALTRIVNPDGTASEYYEGYNFSRYPLKVISRNHEAIKAWEPTAIEIGEVPESALVHRSEWPVDFSHFEKKLQRMQSANPSDPLYAQQAQRMHQQVEQAKQRLSAQGYRIK